MARIEDYAIVGDLQTAALVGKDGSIDWLCLPRFDSAACFAALVGTPANGRWRLAPTGAKSCTTRSYRPGTLILDTVWDGAGGSVRVTDFMPVRGEAPDVVRIVEGLSGSVEMRSDLVLRLDYGHVVPWVRHLGGQVEAIAGPDALWLRSPVHTHGEDDASVSRFRVTRFTSNRPRISTTPSMPSSWRWPPTRRCSATHLPMFVRSTRPPVRSRRCSR